jgi:hypothetical protein
VGGPSPAPAAPWDEVPDPRSANVLTHRPERVRRLGHDGTTGLLGDPAALAGCCGGVCGGATSATNAWAVGVRYGRATGGLIEHWNGTAWTLARSPALASGGLTGVTALSGTSAWAVGETFPSSQPPQTVIERWNGTSWARVPSPAPGFLASVTATSARNAWAVGVSAPTRNATGIIEHWDGNSWTCISATGTAGPCPAG